MTEELIREIVTGMFKEQTFLDWKFYLIIIVLSFLGSFLGTYFKKRGELWAIKDNFSNVLKQLKRNTEVTEEVKTNISHSDWTQREWKTLRRVKLEELLTTVNDVMFWLESEHSHIKETGKGNETPNPLSKALTIARLYFPELVEEVRRFNILANEYQVATMESVYGIYSSTKLLPDIAVLQSHMEAYASLFESHNIKLQIAVQNAEVKAADLMKTVMDI